jgi:hypothetical protein
MLGPLVRSSVLKGCPVDASDQLDVNDRAGTGKHQTIKNPESPKFPVEEHLLVGQELREGKVCPIQFEAIEIVKKPKASKMGLAGSFKQS